MKKHSFPRGLPFFLAVFILVAVAAAPVAAEQTKKPWTPDDIWKLKPVSDHQLSPDGEWIAYVVAVTDFEENKRNSDIWLMPSRGGKGRRMTTSPQGDNHPRWSPDGKSIAFLSGRSGSNQIYILPVEGGEARKVTDFPGGVGDLLWTPDGGGFIFTARTYLDCPDLDCIREKDKKKEDCKVSALVHKHLLYRHWDTYEDGKVQHLYYIDAGGGDPEDLTPSLQYDALTYWLASAGRDFDISPDGGTIYFSGKQDEDQAVSYNEEIWRVTGGGGVERVTSNPAADSHPRVSPCGRYLAYRATRRPGYESDRYELMVMLIPDGEPRSLTADLDLSVGAFFWGYKGDKLYFTAEDRADINLFQVPFRGGKVTTLVGGEGEAGHGYHLDFRAGPKDKFFVYRYRPMTHYYELFRCNSKGKKVERLSHVNDDLYREFHTPDAEEIWYEGVAGARVHGFLVKPMNFDPGKKYPLLVRIHGGPQQMFGYAYRTEFAIFSGADYAVFFCNPRGSTGYGQEFCDGINRDWGGKVIGDIKSGVAQVLEDYPWIDASKVGAWGGSFGGFVCNWLQGHNQDGMFSVLVSHAGEADQWSSYGSTEELWFPEWELSGTPWDNPEMNDKYSPIRYAQDFSTPHLIIHGELDYRVPITGGEQMFTALQRMKVPSKMIRFPDENHWILQPHNQRFWNASILDWFEQWLRRGGREIPAEGAEKM
ncbi:MAG: S9 family peptidase [Candidatus Krumholzibacteriota bacterium]|nr:S9 family peptidase [Candidatus Krumholzibacteriota bacterium]